MFVRTAFFFLLLNLTGVMLFKLKKNDEIEIPENRKRPNGLFVLTLQNASLYVYKVKCLYFTNLNTQNSANFFLA